MKYKTDTESVKYLAQQERLLRSRHLTDLQILLRYKQN